MGRFFTNLQIKNFNGRDGFFKAFKSAATGWEICGEQEADRVLLLGFSECYVTVACGLYNDDPEAAECDAAAFSAALDTEVFSVSGIDSDAAVMSVYCGGRFVGKTAVGAADAYGMEAEPPARELWEPMLKPGADFSALSEIWRGDAVFVEELLSDSAELFGIKPDHMTADIGFFDDGERLFLRKSAECPIRLAPKPARRRSQPSGSQTDDGTVMIFGRKYDIASTTSLDCSYSNITDDEFAAEFPNIKRLTALKELDLYNNFYITDISMLAELPGLEELNVSGNDICDISVLDKLPKLKRLSLEIDKRISDLSPLERQRGLEELLLWFIEFVPEWIKEFKALKKLSLICSRKITDISPLSALTELTDLDLRYNAISDITPLLGLSKLVSLVLAGNRISKADYLLLKGRLPNCVIYIEKNLE